MTNARIATYLGLLMLSSGLSHATEPYVDYRKRVESAENLTSLKDSLFGESVSLYDGRTSFSATDIDLAGNNALPLRLSRRFPVEITPGGASTFNPNLGGAGGWDVDVPYITGMFASGADWPSNRCTGSTVPPPPLAPGIDAYDVWQGNTIHIPWESDRAMLATEAQTPVPSDGIVHKWTTNQRDIIDCTPMKSGLSGEGYVVRTQSGLRYYFDRAVSRYAGYLTTSFPPTNLARNRVFLLVSRIVDRFGNSVDYTYNDDGYPTAITASDGRQITATYVNGRLSKATANGKTWTYSYTDVQGIPLLSTVQLPDQSRWQFAYSDALAPLDQVWDGGSNSTCSVKPPPLPEDFTLTITHPSNAVGTFQFQNRREYRSGVHMSECLQRVSGGQYYYVLHTPNYFDIVTLDRKTISGPGLPTYVWTYQYSTGPQPLWGTRGSAAAYPCTTCTTEKQTKVTSPDGTYTVYRYGMQYALNEGRLLGSTLYNSSGAAVRIESTTYMTDAEAAAQGMPTRFGIVIGGSDPSAAAVRPVVATSIQQDGYRYSSTVDKGCNSSATYCIDLFGRPTRQVKQATPSP